MKLFLSIKEKKKLVQSWNWTEKVDTNHGLIVPDKKILHLPASEKRHACDKKVGARKLYLADADALI